MAAFKKMDGADQFYRNTMLRIFSRPVNAGFLRMGTGKNYFVTIIFNSPKYTRKIMEPSGYIHVKYVLKSGVELVGIFHIDPIHSHGRLALRARR